jgi:leucyl aminopeptidase
MASHMSKSFFPPAPYLAKARKTELCVYFLTPKTLRAFLKSRPVALKTRLSQADFSAKPKTSFALHDLKTGSLEAILVGLSDPVSYFDGAIAAEAARSALPDSALAQTSFRIENQSGESFEKLAIGWGWGCYKFESYKEKATAQAMLNIANAASPAQKKRIQAFSESVNTLRNLINTPANDCGPEELESFAKTLAKSHNATVKTITDQQLLSKNLPLIYTVGKASPRRPRLIELTWGNPAHPKLTLVGKGVCFDTGGLDIKPSAYMRYMKKDMGGAAHAFGVAMLIMTLNIPVRLTLLIAAVENSIAGEAFRPGDIIKSRKGIFVENTNTDAEGRLILADTLTYACESKPELIIDFATLTGSARAALGPDIPAMFSNNPDIAKALQDISFAAEDPVWNMPLWQSYKKHNKSSAADMVNSAGIPGDLIYSALFLESFLLENKKDKAPAKASAKAPDWVHLDCYAWEQTGRAGRPVGAADTGMRAVFAYLEQRYGKAKPAKAKKTASSTKSAKSTKSAAKKS